MESTVVEWPGVDCRSLGTLYTVNPPIAWSVYNIRPRKLHTLKAPSCTYRVCAAVTVPLKYLRNDHWTQTKYHSYEHQQTFFSEMQRQTEHACHLRYEHVAGGQVTGHWSLGRRWPSCQGLASLRGACSGHHDQRQRPRQIRHVGALSSRGRIWLGVLWVTWSHPLLC